MSDFNSSLGTFNPYNYKSNDTGYKVKQRMAGDYMSDFINANANDKKDKQKDFTYQGSNGKDYGTNIEKMLFGNSPTSSKKEVSSQPVEKPIDTEVAKGTTDKMGRPIQSTEQTTEINKGTTDKMGRPTQVSTLTEGQKLAQNVRPEYAKQAADFYDKTAAKYGDRPELMGNILTHMGGDAFLPDPDKVKASWEKKYADRPELLANINMYMGGGAGKVGHNR